MKIALFLGAGASVPYGMPTTREMQDKIRAGNPVFPRKDLLDCDQFPDIEHVLSALDQLITFAESRAGELYAEHGGGGPDDGSGGAAGRVITTSSIRRHEAYKISARAFNAHVSESRKAKEIIERFIAQSYRWSSSNDECAGKVLKSLFDLVKSRGDHVTIFTTNYDTVIESYCGDPARQAERIDGFEMHKARRIPVWTGKFTPHDPDYRTKVYLYKLHGSMNWLADDYGGQMSIVQKPNTDASSDRNRDMYIRPSLDTKDDATQKEPYATILDKFSQTLPSFDACIVVGYSFRDPHISEQLVKFAKSGKILVVLSPTAASDFKNNALKGELPSGKKGKWRGSKSVQTIMFESKGALGIVYAVNERLREDTVNVMTKAIKSLIKVGTLGNTVADTAVANIGGLDGK